MQCFSDSGGQFGLKFEYVAGGQFPIEPLSPEVHIGSRVDYLYVQTHPIARFLHRPFDDRTGLQSLGDLSDGRVTVLERQD